ncbi:hypothetical protein QSH57_005522 [Fusarium oxysporum f. sp. vasinfectum]|nr:hypothetical protein QSH57_005522 [Fusarium oxysporum f. sp. vasinfectum]
MSTWMNDAVPNHNGNGFPHMNDSNAAGNMMDPSAFMANPGQFNPAQFNQQMGGAMANGPGSMRNASPSFQNPVYQTNSVIPSKRPRPREDSLAGSPSQNPGMLPTSRSETPQQQPFAGGFQPGAVQQNPGQFSHLQPNGSANASPSPIMSNQMRPGSVPQRVATASPHPFSPSGQQFNPQTSPIPSEHGTPQPNPYMQNMAQGFNPNFAPSPSNARPSPNPNAMTATPQKQMQPGQQMTPGAMGQSGPPAQMQQTPMKQMQPGQPPVNGFSTPQPQMQPQPPVMPGQNRTLSQTIDASAVPEFPGAPSPATRRAGSISQNEGRQASAAPVVVEKMPRLAPQTDEYSPCARELSTFGGVDLNAFSKLGAELERWKPDVPPLQELGNIDIGALTKSLQSGIHGETRLALDVLAAASCSMNQLHFIQLRYCDELIEALIECAEDQVEMLAEHTAEVSDEIQISPYEDVLRACRLERFNIRDLPVFGTQEYELDRAVDRLICVTTILRNLSFPGEQNDNHSVLADEIVIKFVCAVIRYLGTRTMLLRSHNNTLDFMKDVVILLSNIAGSVEIPGREQALCLLQFLLAFAPAPNPTVSDGTLFFTQYEPSLHAYLPHAVDALAKLLARDEPNRGHYKAVFALDSNSSPPYELLTRAFGLAIAPIPDKARTQTRQPNLPSLVEARKPFLMQGLLSAEILASLAPGHDSGVAQSWLSSGNDFAQNLFRLIRELSQLYEQPQVQGPRTAPQKTLSWCISLLLRLLC